MTLTIRQLIVALAALPDHTRPVRMTDAESRGLAPALDIAGVLDNGDEVEVTYSAVAVDQARRG